MTFRLFQPDSVVMTIVPTLSEAVEKIPTD